MAGGPATSNTLDAPVELSVLGDAPAHGRRARRGTPCHDAQAGSGSGVGPLACSRSHTRNSASDRGRRPSSPFAHSCSTGLSGGIMFQACPVKIMRGRRRARGRSRAGERARRAVPSSTHPSPVGREPGENPHPVGQYPHRCPGTRSRTCRSLCQSAWLVVYLCIAGGLSTACENAWVRARARSATQPSRTCDGHRD